MGLEQWMGFVPIFLRWRSLERFGEEVQGLYFGCTEFEKLMRR